LENWDDFVSDYPTDMVLVQKDAATYRLMSSRSDWPLAYEDSISAVFVHSKEILKKLRHKLPETNLRPEVQSFP
jgi:hypothetical protein